MKKQNDLAPYDEEAKTMNVRQFAERHYMLNKIRLCGNPSIYTCVDVEGVSYLWSIVDGKYDGWDRSMRAHDQN